MAKEYQPQVQPESPASCAHCDWQGTQEALKQHLATWDDEGNPIRPACPGVRFYIDPDPKKWTSVERYAVLARKNRLTGMKSRKASREAAIEVGYRERAEPMSDEVKATLREHNERKRELRESMKKRAKAKSKKKPRRGRRKKRT